MTKRDKSIEQTAKGFVISAGTQVVLKVAKGLSGGAGQKKTGSVGVVVESPADSAGAYVVQFADEQTVKAYRNELTLRRREVDDELAEMDEDMRPHIIYVCQVGSKAFGLAGDDSDDDLRGIYLPPASLHWSLYKLPEQIETIDDERDEVYWEREKFVRLALKANPNVLETLWTPLILKADETAQELRAIRESFLSQRIFKTYSGYVLSQFRRMANAQRLKGTYKSKHAMHLLRLLHSGIVALKTGQIQVDMSHRREELLDIRNNKRPFEEVKRMALELDKEFQKAFDETSLPERPDYAKVNEFLVRARRRMVDA